MNKSAALAAASLALASACTAKLVVHPVPEGIPTNERFGVQVRIPGGEWRPVSCPLVEVDMHQPRPSSAAFFDFAGTVEISIAFRGGPVRSACIRPLSAGLEASVEGNTLSFSLDRPRNLSIEVNGDRFGNLHLFAGPLESGRPDPQDPGVIYFGPGVHEPGKTLAIPSRTTVYLAGGAFVKTKLLCDRVTDVRIVGRGVLYHGHRGIEITRSRDIEIDGLAVLNPQHYTVFGGASQNLTIRNLKSFSSRGWSDGIDLMSCSDVLVEGAFLRNSDDCIAIYGHRWKYSGDARNITVRNSVLWADVAHPVNIGTHGNPASPELIENLVFSDLDILEHDEPQIGYQGCIAINASDANLVRDVRVENLRIEDFAQGQLVNLRVAFNRKYATAPGRGIHNVLFKDVSYRGDRANISILTGYDEARGIDGIVFENFRINGHPVRSADEARFFVGEHVRDLVFLTAE